MSEKSRRPVEGEAEVVPYEPAPTRAAVQRRDASDARVSLEAVQVYVEAERKRVRRILFGISSLFLSVVLLIFAVFLAIGVFVLNNTVAAKDQIRAFRDRVAVRMSEYDREVQVVGERLEQAQAESTQVASGLAQAEQARTQDRGLLQGDLERFSSWVATQDQRLAQRLKAAEARQAELDALIQRLTAQLDAGAAGAAPAAGATLAPVSARVALPAALPAVSVPAPSAGGATNGAPGMLPPAVEGSFEGVSPPAAAGDVQTVRLPNGDEYEGELLGGQIFGAGVYRFKEGPYLRYEGTFRDGLRHGRGVLVLRSGARYEGDFVADRMEGHGAFHYLNGDRYEGGFLDGEKHGEGRYEYQNGNVFIGGFSHGGMEGKGVLAFANGDRYTGDFRAGRREGVGIYEYAGGGRYEGAFLDGRRHGQGRYTYVGGGVYEGAFVEGRKHGAGVYRFPDGAELAGVWRADEYAGVTEREKGNSER